MDNKNSSNGLKKVQMDIKIVQMDKKFVKMWQKNGSNEHKNSLKWTKKIVQIGHKNSFQMK